jgi:hypothetical protein
MKTRAFPLLIKILDEMLHAKQKQKMYKKKCTGA